MSNVVETRRRIGKRLLSLALAAAMAVTTMGAQAFAAGEENGADTAVTATVPDRVLSWSWPENSALTWAEDTRTWTLACAVSEEQPLTEETLHSLLPAQITAEVQPEVAAATADTAATAEGAVATGQDAALPAATESDTAASAADPQDLSLDLTWDFTGLTFPLASGTYTLAAGLPQGYLLEEGTPAIQVTLQVSAADMQANEIQAASIGTVIGDTVSPVGTTINLFDYWVTTQGAPDAGNVNNVYVGFNYGDNNSTGNVDTGINEGHAFKFSNGDGFYSGQEWYRQRIAGMLNVWTGSEQTRSGLVKNTLGNGYPQLNYDTAKDEYKSSKLNYGESLAYLFNSDTVQGKQTWQNVKGLLQMGDSSDGEYNGYYYYDCTKNFAKFNASTNSFDVYNAKKEYINGSHKEGQFFPFDEASYTDGNPQSTASSNTHHYFGLTMTTRFVQQPYGTVEGTEGGTPVTYEFSGDDDVWVFIDDVLVGDLGGIHNAASLKIDFQTGTVVINAGTANEQKTSLYDCFVKAEKQGDVQWQESSVSDDSGGQVFKNGTYHTLKFFYLERGNSESNMKLKFNLVSIPQSDLIKVDQLGDPVPGAEFKLYYANDAYEPRGEAIATGVTDETGSFVFMRDDGTLLSLNALKDLYGKEGKSGKFILQESKVPSGYRTAGDIRLYFADSDQAILLSANPWDTGAYAMPMLTATLPEQPEASPQYGNNQSVPEPGTTAGTFFAAVMKKDGDKWYPVSGDPIKGWQVHKPGQEETLEDAILEAARATNYVFQLDSSGEYKATIEDLPGSIMQYYYMLLTSGNTTQEGDSQDEGSPQETAANQAQYTVAYYYTRASNLQNATDLIPLNSNIEDKSDEGYFPREFSVRLYVPNIKNVLIVQKVDENDNPLTGAQFTLTRQKSDTTEDNDSTWTDQTVETKNLSQADKDIITLDGAAVFPTEGGTLPNGTYILTETKAPDGYAASTQETTIVVDNTGVYADAGKEDDDVTVLRGAGNLVRSMVQFAEKDDVDMTLHDITATLYESTTLPDSRGTHIDEGYWDAWKSPDATTSSPPPTIQLSYGSSNHVLDYGLAPGQTGDLYFEVDAGWSSVKITQTAFDKTEEPLKQELGSQDLSNLFSRSTIVRVQNSPIGLTIKKTVVDPAYQSLTEGDKNQQFTIRIELSSGDSTPLKSQYKYRDAQGQEQVMSFSNGVGEITLKNGESINLYDLPENTTYTVTENDENAQNYTPSYSVQVEEEKPTSYSRNATGTLTNEKKNQTVTVINTRKTGATSVSKTVTGNMGDKTKPFTFSLVLTDNGTPVTGTFNARIVTGGTQPGKENPITFTTQDGVTASQSVELTHGQTLIFDTLPVGATLTATETSVAGYTTKVNSQQKNSGTVTVSATETAVLAFVNDCTIRPPTGLYEETGPYKAMVGLAGAAALAVVAGWVELRRRKRREQE